MSRGRGNRMSDSVQVVCTEPSHEGKVVKVAHFLRNQGSIARWHEWGASTLKASRAAEDARAREPGVIGQMRHLPPKDQPQGAQVIHGGQPVQGGPLAQGGAVSLPDTHVKYALECPKCGLNVQATEGRLLPILDRLGEACVLRISLAALRARLQ